MRMRQLAILLVASSAVAQSPLTIEVPNSLAVVDGPARLWIPGGHKDLRQQTLIGSSHLVTLLGHTITGLQYRRNVAGVNYSGGAANMAVCLSTSPNVPLEASSVFGLNVGPDATQVFQGIVVFPVSPAPAGPTVPWSVDNVVRIAFSQPFTYTGGTLCVDITGTTISGQVASGWLADAAYDYTIGNAADTGSGCGPGVNALGQWSWVSPHSLLTGSLAAMWAHGPAGDWAVTVIGPSGPPFPLSMINLGQPGCNAYLSDIIFLGVCPFMPENDVHLQGIGGVATYELKIPLASWVLGAQLTTQWLDLVTLYSSNAVTWTIAPAAPTLEMALVDGVANDTTGNVSVYLAHVFRFEYQ